MYSPLVYEMNLTNNWINSVKLQPNKNVFPPQWTMWYFFTVMETYSTSVKNVVLFFSYGDRLLNAFNNVCSETSLKKCLPTAVKNVVIFFSYGYKLINTFNYCMQWNLNPTKNLTTSVNNVVIFPVMEIDPNSVNNVVLFQLWRHINQPL